MYITQSANCVASTSNSTKTISSLAEWPKEVLSNICDRLDDRSLACLTISSHGLAGHSALFDAWNERNSDHQLDHTPMFRAALQLHRRAYIRRRAQEIEEEAASFRVAPNIPEIQQAIHRHKQEKHAYSPGCARGLCIGTYLAMTACTAVTIVGTSLHFPPPVVWAVAGLDWMASHPLMYFLTRRLTHSLDAHQESAPLRDLQQQIEDLKQYINDHPDSAPQVMTMESSMDREDDIIKRLSGAGD